MTSRLRFVISDVLKALLVTEVHRIKSQLQRNYIAWGGEGRRTFSYPPVQLNQTIHKVLTRDLFIFVPYHTAVIVKSNNTSHTRKPHKNIRGKSKRARV